MACWRKPSTVELSAKSAYQIMPLKSAFLAESMLDIPYLPDPLLYMMRSGHETRKVEAVKAV